jgi:hypothetical protein
MRPILPPEFMLRRDDRPASSACRFDSSVDARQREIATLRTLGFGSVPVFASVLSEGMLLALGAGLVGAVFAWLVFNGKVISTRDAQSSDTASGLSRQ